MSTEIKHHSNKQKLAPVDEVDEIYCNKFTMVVDLVTPVQKSTPLITLYPSIIVFSFADDGIYN
jgi:hypothetical protein